MNDTELLHAVQIVEDRLTQEFGERVSHSEIAERTRASFRRYHRARITTFVPIFVQRDVREELQKD